MDTILHTHKEKMKPLFVSNQKPITAEVILGMILWEDVFNEQNKQAKAFFIQYLKDRNG